MRRRIVLLVVVLLGAGLFAATPTAVAGTLACDPDSGHCYEAVDGPTNWEVARSLAEEMGGYLATVTSQAETDFLLASFGVGALIGHAIGGYQEPGVVPADAGWQWITGESFEYTNWAQGEPNDSGWPAREQYLGLWYGGGWNDGTTAWSGFIVEYVPPMVAQVEKLVEMVEDLNLDNGISNALDAKLANAVGALVDVNQHNDVAAVNKLEAFINEVQAQAGNKIPQADADALIAAAQQIIDLITAG